VSIYVIVYHNVPMFVTRTHREKKSWFILNQDFLFHISGKIKKREHAVLGTFPSIV